MTLQCLRISPVSRSLRRALRASLAFALTALFVFALSISSSHATELERWALVIGSSQGVDGEERLRHSGRDAQRLADVLIELGRVSEDRLTLLRDAHADDIAAALADIKHRLQQAHPGDINAADAPERELVFYYSGHAGPGALHAGGVRFPFEDLVAQLHDLPVQTRILILDACRSGELTRLKGAVPDEPFPLLPASAPRSSGLAILTSASAEEFAQESDRIQGSFFTHHLIAGLRGAADRTSSGRVTLGEAYRYAYDETLRSTSGAAHVQHPTYAFELRGREDIVLTHLMDNVPNVGALLVGEAGHYLLFNGHDEGSLVAELNLDGRPVRLLLPEGAYLMRHRRADFVSDRRIEITAGGTAELAHFSERRAGYAATVRKGGPGDRRSVIGVSLGPTMSASAVPGGDPLLGAGAGIRLELAPITFGASFSAGTGRVAHTFEESRVDQLSFGLSAQRFLDYRRLSLGLGGELALDALRQTIGESDAYRRSLVPRLGALVTLQYSVHPRWALVAEGGFGGLLADVEGSGRSARGALRGGLHLLAWFP